MKDEKRRTCSTHGRGEKCIQHVGGRTERHGIGSRIILKLILKHGMSVWFGLI
jgi:hypothetical protein